MCSHGDIKRKNVIGIFLPVHLLRSALISVFPRVSRYETNHTTVVFLGS